MTALIISSTYSQCTHFWYSWFFLCVCDWPFVIYICILFNGLFDFHIIWYDIIKEIVIWKTLIMKGREILLSGTFHTHSRHIYMYAACVSWYWFLWCVLSYCCSRSHVHTNLLFAGILRSINFMSLSSAFVVNSALLVSYFHRVCKCVTRLLEIRYSEISDTDDV